MTENGAMSPGGVFGTTALRLILTFCLLSYQGRSAVPLAGMLPQSALPPPHIP